MMNKSFAISVSAMMLFFSSGLLLAQSTMDITKVKDLAWMPCDPNAPDGVCQLTIIRGDPAKEASNQMIVLIMIKGAPTLGAEGGQEQETIPGVGDYVQIPPKRLPWGDQCTFYRCVEGPNTFYLREKK
jgi:hypothetical protein